MKRGAFRGSCRWSFPPVENWKLRAFSIHGTVHYRRPSFTAVRFIFQTWTIYHRPCPPLTKSAAKMELVKNIKAPSLPVNESEPRLEARNIVTLAHVRLLPVPWTFPFWEIAMALGKIARPTGSPCLSYPWDISHARSLILCRQYRRVSCVLQNLW